MTVVPRTERVEWIDAAKGLGIVLIVLGHITSVETPSWFYIYLYAFHVPLFFFVSGLTFKPAAKRWGRFFGDKVRTLLVPYLCYALLGYAFYLAGYLMAKALHLQIEQFNYGPWHPLFGVFYGTLGNGNLVNTPVWFIIALFCTVLMGYAVNTWLPNMPLRLIAVGLLACAGYLASRQFILPFSLSSALIGLVFFQAGHLHARSRFQLNASWQQWLAFAVLFVASLFSYLNGFVTLADTVIGQPLAYVFFAFVGTYAVILLVQGLGPSGRWLARLGQYSMAIMVIHMLIIKSVKVVLAAALHRPISAIEAQWMPSLVVLLATVVLLVPAVYVLERFVPATLGKRASGAGRPAMAQA